MPIPRLSIGKSEIPASNEFIRERSINSIVSDGHGKTKRIAVPLHQ